MGDDLDYSIAKLSQHYTMVQFLSVCECAKLEQSILQTYKYYARHYRSLESDGMKATSGNEPAELYKNIESQTAILNVLDGLVSKGYGVVKRISQAYYDEV